MRYMPPSRQPIVPPETAAVVQFIANVVLIVSLLTVGLVLFGFALAELGVFAWFGL